MKRFYEEGEIAWVKSKQTTGKVVALDIPNLRAIVSFRTLTGNHDEIIMFEDLDKLRTAKAVEKRTAKQDTILFAKVRPDAIIPSKRFEDSGYDIYANFEQEQIEIKPSEVVLIPTGIASSLLPKYRFIVKERSSTGTKCMAVRAGVIDSGYRGEWFIAMNNTGRKNIIISKHVNTLIETDHNILYPYTKAIAQANLEIVPAVKTKTITFEELQAIPSERKAGKSGDSGK